MSEMSPRFESSAEWLEAEGLGGVASGTVSGARTRRYHALLLVATTPPTGRLVWVNGLDAFVEIEAGNFAISSQRYPDGIVSPDGASRLVSWEPRPWPVWRWQLPNGSSIEHEIFVPKGAPMAVMCWRRRGGQRTARLVVRLFLSGRDYHSMHHRNGAFRFEADESEGRVRWRPCEGVPAVIANSSGRYEAAPDGYRRVVYSQEAARGLDCEEDLATPGRFHFDVSAGEAVLLLGDG